MGIFKRGNITGIIVFGLFVAIVIFVFYWRTQVEDVPGDYHVKKGNYRLEDGLYKDAIEEFNLALKTNSEHPDAYLGLAITYMQMGNNREAMKNLNRTIDLDPDQAIAYADRGILYDRMGKYRLALADYKRALKLNPKVVKGPGWLWRFLKNVKEKPPSILARARYLEKELKKPPEKRILTVPDADNKQLMYKYE